MRSAARNIAFAFVPLVAVLLLAGVGGELWLRAQHAQARGAIEAKAKGPPVCTRASADPRRIYEGVPGKCGQNALGFRDVEHAPAKPAGTFRIAIIGDSVAAGQGVRADEAFARVIERALVAQGLPVEVLVFATTGYSTSQELALLDIAYRYAPDLVVWTYVLNDPADPVADNANGELGVYFDAPPSRALAYVATLWQRARVNIAARDCPEEWHRRMHCAHRDDIARHFGEIARSSKAHGIPVVLAVLPVLPEAGFADYALRTVHDDLRTLADAQGLPVIDTLPAFAAVDVNDVRLAGGSWVDPWHPNAKGHALIGEFLARELQARVARPRVRATR